MQSQSWKGKQLGWQRKKKAASLSHSTFKRQLNDFAPNLVLFLKEQIYLSRAIDTEIIAGSKDGRAAHFRVEMTGSCSRLPGSRLPGWETLGGKLLCGFVCYL